MAESFNLVESAAKDAFYVGSLSLAGIASGYWESSKSSCRELKIEYKMSWILQISILVAMLNINAPNVHLMPSFRRNGGDPFLLVLSTKVSAHPLSSKSLNLLIKM